MAGSNQQTMNAPDLRWTPRYEAWSWYCECPMYRGASEQGLPWCDHIEAVYPQPLGNEAILKKPSFQVVVLAPEHAAGLSVRVELKEYEGRGDIAELYLSPRTDALPVKELDPLGFLGTTFSYFAMRTMIIDFLMGQMASDQWPCESAWHNKAKVTPAEFIREHTEAFDIGTTVSRRAMADIYMRVTQGFCLPCFTAANQSEPDEDLALDHVV